MSPVDDIMSQIPLGQLAGQLGVNPQEAEQAVRTALPALLGGIHANTQDPGGAQSFAQAVQQHDPSLVEGGVDLNQVNPDDGQKIVNHVFGANQGQVVQQLGGVGSASSGLIQKLLPILAPIVMAYLAKQLTGAPSNVGAGGGGGGLGGMLGGLLGGVLGGGGGAQQQQQSSGPDLGSILGGLLGGGTR
ncbi:MAG: DUF937 domain-containing protein [Pseudonocardiales bacterium]|nr:DUF937 domain-containing protein [Pseudonocardiales bacterium]